MRKFRNKVKYDFGQLRIDAVFMQFFFILELMTANFRYPI